jgi:hypothetical protein
VYSIAARHESDSDDMVKHHLHMVRATLLRVDNKNLVKVEGSLSKVVEFDGASHGVMRKPDPEVNRVKKTRWEVVMNILYILSERHID